MVKVNAGLDTIVHLTRLNLSQQNLASSHKVSEMKNKSLVELVPFKMNMVLLNVNIVSWVTNVLISK